MSDSTGMDPCTLSSIKLFTEGVLILSPCPRTPASCQNLLVVVVIKAYARAQVFALFSRGVAKVRKEASFREGSCIRRDRAGKDGTKRRDQILRAQAKASDIK